MNSEVFTSELRIELKKIMAKEIKKMPEYLDSLEPKDRINMICKLMPYIFPKIDTVHATANEPMTFGEW